MIMAGAVTVNGERVDKAGHLFPVSADINLKASPSFASRGGIKLEGAIKHFGLDVTGRLLLDVGASTGGFTDCLLKRGTRHVMAIDVGYGQLDWRLRQDERVTVMDKTNIRYLMPEDLGMRADGAVIDVSFISLKLVVPPVSRLLEDQAFILALIKPQFEVGKGRVGKGGVVRDSVLHTEVIQDISAFCVASGWSVAGTTSSSILGPKGNREFFIYLERGV